MVFHLCENIFYIFVYQETIVFAFYLNNYTIQKKIKNL